MIKLPSWTPHDLKFVLDLFDKGVKQSGRGYNINQALIDERKRIGTWKGEKDLSWQISRLSPRSKHRKTDEAKIRDPWSYHNVVTFIQKCLHCNYYKASDVYLTNIIESGISDYNFYNPNYTGMVAIRFEHPKQCKDSLYIAFTSEDYDDMSEDSTEVSYEMNEDTGELEETITSIEHEQQDHLWIVETPYSYQQLLTGKVTLTTLKDYLTEIADGYVPIYVNCCIIKDDTEV